MRSLLVSVSTVVRAVWDDLFPPTCPGCDRSSPSGALCRSCYNRLTTMRRDACARCEEQRATRGGLCRRCRRSRSALDAVRAGALYQGLCLERLRRFKYPQSSRFLEPGPDRFAAWLILRAAERVEPPPDVIVPVPHHPRRLRSRGFVPALLLARHVACAIRRPVRSGLLQRVRDTSSQTRLGRRQRRHNVRGAFRASGAAPDHVWLVDDVVTTGATLEAAARVLRDAGARSIVGIAAARTPRSHRITSAGAPSVLEGRP